MKAFSPTSDRRRSSLRSIQLLEDHSGQLFGCDFPSVQEACGRQDAGKLRVVELDWENVFVVLVKGASLGASQFVIGPVFPGVVARDEYDGKPCHSPIHTIEVLIQILSPKSCPLVF